MAILPNGLNLSQAFVGNSEVQSAWLGNTKIWEKQTPTGRLYLYNQGDECTAVTGGWMQGSHAYNNPSSVWGNIVKSSDNIICGITPMGGGIFGLATINTIDTSNYTKLVFKFKTTNSSVFCAYITNDNSGYGYVYNSDSALFYESKDATEETIYTYEFNIGTNNFNARIAGGVAVKIGSTYTALTLYQVWLE